MAKLIVKFEAQMYSLNTGEIYPLIETFQAKDEEDVGRKILQFTRYYGQQGYMFLETKTTAHLSQED